MLADALKVFISYSRVDMAAADRMVADLERNGFSVTIDRRDLPYGEEWQTELASFIAASDTVVWLVSPASVKSKWVNWELGEVGRLSKRLLPVKVAETDPSTLPEALGRIHLLPAEGVYEASRHEADLVRALNTDRGWLKRATSLGEDAREWLAANRDGAHLLRGRALAEAEAWSVRPPRDVPAPASEILELILASRRGQDRRRRLTVAGSIAAAVIALGLAATAVWFGLRAEEQAAEAERQSQIASEREARAVENETVGLAALSGVALSEGRPVDAIKFALSAWPRSGDARPATRRAVEAIAAALPHVVERMRLEPHEGGLVAAGFIENGYFSASESGVLSVWGASGQEILRLSGFDFSLVDPQVRGDRVAGVSTDGSSIRLVSLDDGTLLQSVPIGARVVGFGYSRSSDVAAAVSDDGVLRVFRASTGEKMLERSAVGEALTLQLSGDGKFIAVSSTTKLIVFNTVGHEVLSASLDRESLPQAVFSTSSRFLAVTVGGDAYVRDLQTGEEHRPSEDLDDPVETLHSSSTSDAFLLMTSDGDAYVFQPGEPIGEKRVLEHTSFVANADIAPELGLGVSAEGENFHEAWEIDPRVWWLHSGGETMRLRGHTDLITSIEAETNGRHVITASRDGTARVWQIEPLPRVAASQPVELVETTVGDFLPGQPVVAVASSQGDLRLWDWQADSYIVLADLGDFSIEQIRVVDETKILLFGQTDVPRLVDIGTGRIDIVPCSVEPGTVRAAADADATKFVIASRDRLTVADRTCGNRLEIKAATDSIDQVAMSTDGTTIAWSEGKRIILADAADGQRIFELETESEMISSIAISPDNSIISFAPIDASIASIEWRLGRLLAKTDGAALTNVKTLQFTQDGGRLISTTWDGEARVWDVLTGSLIAKFGDVGVPEDVAWSGSMSENAHSFVTGHNGGVVRIWDSSTLENGDAFQIACQRLGNNTSLKDVQERYGLGELTPICGDNPPLPVDWSKLQ